MNEHSAVHPPFTTMLLSTTSQLESQTKWRQYLAKRQGTYEDRKRRYEQVAEVLLDLGLDNTHQVLDFGAGQTEFDYYLRKELDWMGWMLNLDGSLTGEDLNHWYTRGTSDFVVCIETIEHMDKPGEMIAKLEAGARMGIVFTTPNPDKVDVKALCPDHKHSISIQDWEEMLYTVQVIDLFGNDGDTIIAYKNMTE